MQSAILKAHGKLLLTSEYFILDGAKGLALPTQVGQRMEVKKLNSTTNTLFWKAYTVDHKLWMDVVIDKTTLLPAVETKEAKTLSHILQNIRHQDASFLKDTNDIEVTTYLEFPNQWGLGSSSTLIYCLAQWAKVDWYQLLNETIGGSGYDVACAGAEGAIIYQIENKRPVVSDVKFDPSFKDNLFFAYLGQKQVSSEGIKRYRETVIDREEVIIQLNRITDAMLKCPSLKEFELLIKQHESIVGKCLAVEPVQSKLFSDYWGAVKSLGAWGGDFVLFTNALSEQDLRTYLKSKNIEVVFRFDELILN